MGCTDPKEDGKKAKADEANAVVTDAVLNRKQNKKEKTYMYEVKWQFKPTESNCWVSKEILTKMGYLKLVQREDERQAAMAGLQDKQLTQPSIEKHLGDFGVDPEGLGALVLACKDYKGGVLIISHDKEFCDNVATEKWIMQGGKLRIEGESKADDDEVAASGNKEAKEVYDGAGNKIDVKANQTLSAKDAKKKIKDLEKKLKDGKKNKTLSEDEMYELEDQIAELKSKQ